MDQEYPAPNRVLLQYQIPLSEVIIDFFDQLKSRTRGYASLDYQFDEYRPEDLVKLEILVNDEPVDALATIVHREDAYHRGQAIISKLKISSHASCLWCPSRRSHLGGSFRGQM